MFTILTAQELGTEISSELGLNEFFKENVGNDISVTISNLDITITGRLTVVYRDSIIVITTIGRQKYLIPKSSIAFVKVKE
jgi:hypothetical protein